MEANPIPLGVVIADRSFTLQDSTGQQRLVTVRLGCPVAVGTDGSLLQPGGQPDAFRCPFQILGLDRDEHVYAPFGQDPFVALQYAINFAGERLDKGLERLGLRNLYRSDTLASDSWIWRYDFTPRH